MKYYTIKCANCGKTKKRENKQKYLFKLKGCKNTFCSRECNHQFYDQRVELPCHWCGKKVLKEQREIKRSKSGHIFCSKSCACSYNVTKRRKSRRSKCEIMLYEMLCDEFPKLEIIANDKKMLDGREIDIGIPELNIGIEWNGIIHYKPIYGQAKLDKIQEKDAKKKEVAKDKEINLIIVPDLVSTDAKVKEAFGSICKIIRNARLRLN